jgi:hypothetical protein
MDIELEVVLGEKTNPLVKKVENLQSPISILESWTGNYANFLEYLSGLFSFDCGALARLEGLTGF